MKLIYKALLSIIILAWFYSTCFSQATLSIGTSNGTPGNSISIPIQATGIVDMTGFQFTIEYDKTKLTYQNCSNWATGINASQVQINSLDGKLTFVYTDAAINIANGKFFDLNFTVINGASGNATISWSDSPTQRELSNSIPNEISCVYSNGVINISVESLLAPVAITATNIAQTSFSANWNTSATATGYRLDVALDNGFTNYLSGYQNKDVGNVTTHQISGCVANTIYYYRVKAYNTGETSGASNTISLTTLQSLTLSPPVAIAATNIAQTSFSANWNSSATATGYRLDVALDNGFTNYLTGYQNKDVGNVTTHQISGCVTNTIYYYRVKAYNTVVTSGVSNIINVTTLSNQNEATLTIGTANGTPGNSISIPVQATGIVDMTGFQFTIEYDKTKLTYLNCLNWATGINATQVQINSLDGKLTFVYTDAAINIANGKFFDLNFTVLNGTSGDAAISWSDSPTKRELSNSIPNEISCVYSNGEIVIGGICIAPGIPATATGAATGATTADLSWSVGSPAGSPTITYYWVVGTSSSVTYGNGVAQGTTNETTASVTGLSINTKYYLRIYAKTSCDGSESGYKTSSSFTTDATSKPTLTLSSTSLVFGNVAEGNTSSPQSFTISGSNLTDNISLSAPNGFVISKTSGSGFVSSLILSQSNGSVSSTIIYVMFKPASTGYRQDNISISSGTLNQSVSVDGTGTSSPCITPGAPANLKGTATSKTSAKLSWSPGNPKGGPVVTYYWVVGTSPDVNYNKGIAQGTTQDTFAFTSVLSTGINYYLRVFSNASCNSIISEYRTSNPFSTNSDASQTVKDYDGNDYTTVKIGSQLWLGQNLKTTKYNDGTIIPLVNNTSTWGTITKPAYCWYNNDVGYKNPYGALYNWYAVNTGKLCPAGWHVPTDDEWKTLVNYLGGESVAGEKLKEIGTIHWKSPNIATNESGFTALPGGTRWSDGWFHNIGEKGQWWSSTEDQYYSGFTRYTYYNYNSIENGGGNKNFGYSVRCICDLQVSNKSLYANDFIKIYPNPASKEIFIESSNYFYQNCMVEIWSMDGKKVKTWENLDLTHKQTLDTTDLISGFYFVRIYSDKINNNHKIIIKQE